MGDTHNNIILGDNSINIVITLYHYGIVVAPGDGLNNNYGRRNGRLIWPNHEYTYRTILYDYRT